MKRIAVFGLGRFGASVAASLQREGVEVLAVDRNRHLVDRLKDDVAMAVSFDATDRENLEKFDVGAMDAVIVGIGDNFEASVMVTLLCRELGVPLIVCKALNDEQRKVLRSVGAHEVVQPENQMGSWLAENLLRRSVVNFVQLPDGYSLTRIVPPEAWHGKTLAELQLLTKERLNLVQVHRPGRREGDEKRIPLPSGDFRLEAGDQLDVIGSKQVLGGFSAPPSEEEGA